MYSIHFSNSFNNYLKITGICNETCVIHYNIILHYKTGQFGLKREMNGK